MTREIFMLCVIGYYFLAMIVIAIVLFVINNKTKKKYQSQINELERQKNLVISSNILIVSPIGSLKSKILSEYIVSNVYALNTSINNLA